MTDRQTETEMEEMRKKYSVENARDTDSKFNIVFKRNSI